MRLLLAVLGAELRQLLREVNTIVFSVLFPVFLFPVVMWLYTQADQLAAGWEERLAPVVFVPDSLVSELPEGVTRVDTPEAADAVVTVAGRVVTVEWQGGDPVSELAQRRLVAALDDPWEVESHDVAPPSEALTSVIARVLPGILVVLGVMASLYPTVEVVVADRERGTLETTLVTAAPRWVFMAGKLVGVGVLTLLALVATLLGALVTLYHLAVLTGAEVGLPPLRILGMLPLAALTALTGAALALVAAAPARSFKQAQNTTTGMSMLVLTAAVLGMLPHAQLAPTLGFVPITGAVIVMRDLLLGEPVGGWAWVAAVELVVVSALATRWATRSLSTGELR
jgi:sodium transport system permease protein